MDDSIQPRCSECADTGFSIIESEGVTRARPCSCRVPVGTASAVESFLEGARVPRRYWECDFQNFDAYGEHAFSLANAKAQAVRYAD